MGVKRARIKIAPRPLAVLSLAAGLVLIAAGVGLIYPPAALIVAGLGLGALGLDELRSR